MGMPIPTPIRTIDELLALPEDGQRHELLDGVHVVTPSPALPHQRILARLHLAMVSAIGREGRYEVFFSPADIRLGVRTLVQPDLFIIPKDVRSWAEAPVPALAVEVLSPSTAARDRGVKRKLYLKAGVEEYWLVDIDARIVERWRRGDKRPVIAGGAFDWRLANGDAGRLDVAGLFL